MLGSAENSDLDGLKTWQRDYSSDFIFPPVASGSGSGFASALPARASSTQLFSHSQHGVKEEGQDLGVIELSSDEEDRPPRGCDMQVLSKGGTAVGGSGKARRRKTGQDSSTTSHTDSGKIQVGLVSWLQTSDGGVSAPATEPQKLSNALAQEENGSNESRRPSGSSRGRRDITASRLGRTSWKPATDVCTDPQILPIPNPHAPATTPSLSPLTGLNPYWACRVCTLYVRCATTLPSPRREPSLFTSGHLDIWIFADRLPRRLNEPDHLACSACATPRGQSSWAGNSG